MVASAQKNPLPDKRVVYLAFKNVFKGQLAQVRKSKIITRLIEQHKEDAAIANLIREHNFDVIRTTASQLLSDRIFDSTLNAKVRFPELFDTSPAQSAEKEASEAEAARNEAKAIKNATQNRHEEIGCGPSAQCLAHENIDHEVSKQPDTPEISVIRKKQAAVGQHVVPASSLFPIYLPLGAQHKLFVHLQFLLERVCYTFGMQSMVEVLQRRGWDCPEAGELHRWAEEFLKNRDIFRKKPDVGRPVDQLFASLTNIRHTAVHRLRLSAKGIEKYLNDAELFVTLVGDTVHLETIAKIRREAQATLEELERNKHLLQLRLEEGYRILQINVFSWTALREP